MYRVSVFVLFDSVHSAEQGVEVEARSRKKITPILEGFLAPQLLVFTVGI